MTDDFNKLFELQQQNKELEAQIRLLQRQINRTNKEKMTYGCARLQHDTSKIGCGPRKDEWLIQIKCITGRDNPRKLYDKYSTIIFNTDRDRALNCIDLVIGDLQGLRKTIRESEEIN